MVLIESDDKDYGDVLHTLYRLIGLKIMDYVSQLDPMYQYASILETLLKYIKVVLVKHLKFTQVKNNDAELIQWLNDSEMLYCYQHLLNNLQELLFYSKAALFQLRPRSEFTKCVIKIYNRLLILLEYSQNEHKYLESMVYTFEYKFQKNWNIVQNSNTFYDEVRDLLSDKDGFVCPPLIDLTESPEHHYFILSLPKYDILDLLVELIQLPMGEIAIFKINSQKLPLALDDCRGLFKDIIEGNDSFLNLGKTLLFLPMKKNDLEISAIFTGGMELRTTSSNNILLKLMSLDSSSWETTWKPIFEGMFYSKGNSIPISPIPNIKNNQDLYYLFKQRYKKLESLKPKGHLGLGFQIYTTKHVYIPEQYSDSSVSKQSFTNNYNDEKLLSLEEIENLNYETLLELDQSISVLDNLEPMCPTPDVQYLKKVGPSFFTEHITSATGQLIEDTESILLENDSNNVQTQNSPIFNLSSDDYKPQLIGKKSSSLFGLLSNKLKLQQKVKSQDSQKMTIPNIEQQCLDKSTSETSIPHTEVSLITDFIALSENTLTFDDTIRLSHWSDNCWKYTSHEWFNLKLTQTPNVSLFIVSEKSNFKMILRISKNWKVMRSAAQDIQIRYPSDDCLASSIQESKSFTIRSLKADKIMSILSHCIKGRIPRSLCNPQLQQPMDTNKLTGSSYQQNVS